MFQAWFPPQDFTPWQQPALPPHPTAPSFPDILWTGITNQSLVWEGGSGMIQYRQAVRLNVRQELRYTFKDENGVVIDLTNYISAQLQVKLLGSAWEFVGGDFAAPLTDGRVFCLFQAFTIPGKWCAQFVAEDGTGYRLFGDILTFRVTDNVEDLAIGDLPYY